MSYLHYKAINWNETEDKLDQLTWGKLTALFWLDTRIPVTNDKKQWDVLSDIEKDAFKKAIAGLASIATFQSEKGYLVIKGGQHTQQEAAIYNNIQFIESVHAKAYNSILIGFAESKEVDAIINWAENQAQIQYKLDRILEVYKTGSALQKRAANLLLEGVLTTSGLFIPLVYATQDQFNNVSEIIRSVLMNESLHVFYIAHKFQMGFSKLLQQEQLELREWVYNLFVDTINNELTYLKQVYDKTDWLEEVQSFVRQQANKALISLGFEPLYSERTESTRTVDSVTNLLTKLSYHGEWTYEKSNKLEADEEKAMSEDDYDF